MKAAIRLHTAKDKKQTKLTKFGFKCPRMKDYAAGGGGPNYREHPPIRRGPGRGLGILTSVLVLNGLFQD